jgi:predicted tellurium resistance membrane protein TerC
VRRQLVKDDTGTEAVQSTYVSDLKRSGAIFGAASGFAALLAVFKGVPYAVDFCSGYLLEQSLSIDNLFVILLIFEYFKIERKNQDRALQYGLIGAFVMRAVFIALGAAMISSFHQVVLVFAGILLYSSYSILFANKDSSKEVCRAHPVDASTRVIHLPEHYSTLLCRIFPKTRSSSSPRPT